jgi:hypothetical protein
VAADTGGTLMRLSKAQRAQLIRSRLKNEPRGQSDVKPGERIYDPDEFLSKISEFIHMHGYAPTVRDIMALMEMKSTSNVLYWLNKLAADGSLDRVPKLSRTITLDEEAVR